MGYQCLHCSRTFATSYALKRHISDKHRYIVEDENKDETNIPIEQHDDDIIMQDYEAAEAITLKQNVESHDHDLHPDEENSEIDDESHETDDVDLTYPLSIDSEDFGGTTLENAIFDKMHPPNTEWPNEIYREFMEIITEYRLSNSCGDRIIKLINKSRQETHNSEKNSASKY